MCAISEVGSLDEGSEEGSDSWANCSNCGAECICGSGDEEESEDGWDEDDTEEFYEDDDEEEYSQEDEEEEYSQEDDSEEESYQEDGSEEGHYVGAICEEGDTESEDSGDQWSGSGDSGSSGRRRYRHRRRRGKNKVAPSLPSLPPNSSAPSLSLPLVVQIVEDWTRQMKHQLPSFFGT